MKKWLIFIQERFEPVSHAVMILFIFTASLLLAMGIEGEAPYFASEYIAGFLVVTLMFFHLRLFDEIKDYETDIRVNPTRPLPRGLIGLKEFKTVTVCVIAAELILSAVFLSWYSAVAALIMIGYSLLMFKEFFIGRWLAPKMELYAVTHTIVSGFMTLFIMSLVTEKFIWELSAPYGLIALVNWMNFNIFEFARKTFSKEEERQNVESYSKRLRPLGAVFLVLMNAAAAIGLLYAATYTSVFAGREKIILAEVILTGLLALSGLLYSAINTQSAAKIYRGTATVYLVFFNALITGIMLYTGQTL